MLVTAKVLLKVLLTEREVSKWVRVSQVKQKISDDANADTALMMDVLSSRSDITLESVVGTIDSFKGEMKDMKGTSRTWRRRWRLGSGLEATRETRSMKFLKKNGGGLQN